MSDTVLYTLADDVATLRLNRPDRLNALTPEMLEAIPAALHRAVDEGARAVLLTGEGRGFCTGADLAAGGAGRDLGDSVERYYNPMATALAELPIPIVSAINGPAAGAGASLAMGADIVVAARSAYLLLAFANIGLVPDAGATWLVAKGAGRIKALEMALLGERLSAEDALAAGMVTRVVDDAMLMDTAGGIARKLASMPTLALGMIRKQVGAALGGTLAQTLAMERDHQARAGASADFGEGVSAFVAKRRPIFSGR